MNSLFTKLCLFKDGDNPIYGESATEISIDDEGVGMFLAIKQHPDQGEQELRFDLDEIDEFIKNLKYMKDIIEQYENLYNIDNYQH